MGDNNDEINNIIKEFGNNPRNYQKDISEGLYKIFSRQIIGKSYIIDIIINCDRYASAYLQDTSKESMFDKVIAVYLIAILYNRGLVSTQDELYKYIEQINLGGFDPDTIIDKWCGFIPYGFEATKNESKTPDFTSNFMTSYFNVSDPAPSKPDTPDKQPSKKSDDKKPSKKSDDKKPSKKSDDKKPSQKTDVKPFIETPLGISVVVGSSIVGLALIIFIIYKMKGVKRKRR